MFPKDEIIIHRCQDGYGPIVVTEDALTRILYFGSANRQSRMLLNRPAIPLMQYMQGILAALVFNPAPRHVTILGLGGGNLASFFLKYIPGCKVTVVELRSAVIDIAAEFFDFPLSHPDVEIVNADARDYFVHCRPHSDLMIVDLFDAHGPSGFVTEEAFLRQCHESVAKQGIVVFNYWNRKQDKVKQFVSKLQNINYNGGVLGYEPNPKRGNVILFSGPFPSIEQTALSIGTKVDILQKEVCLDLAHVVNELCCYRKAGMWPGIFRQPTRLSSCV